MNKGNYYLHKDKLSGEVLYLEYDKIKGYDITPKTKIEDAIRVNKIVFVNPSLSEKIIKKKIEIKIRYLIKTLDEFESDPSGGDEAAIRNSLMDAERLKLNILNTYVKYLGNTYGSFSIKKIQIIINQLRIKLYDKVTQRRIYESVNNQNLIYDVMNIDKNIERKTKIDRYGNNEQLNSNKKTGIKSSMDMNIGDNLYYLDEEEPKKGRGR